MLLDLDHRYRMLRCSRLESALVCSQGMAWLSHSELETIFRLDRPSKTLPSTEFFCFQKELLLKPTFGSPGSGKLWRENISASDRLLSVGRCKCSRPFGSAP